MTLRLTTKQVSRLRSLAHHLDPLVQVGKHGVSEALIEQVDEQLHAHELIKVRFGREAPQSVQESREQLAQATRSQVIQTTGRTLVLYRRHPNKPKISLAHDPGEVNKKGPRQDPRLSLRRKLGKARRAQREREAAADDAPAPNEGAGRGARSKRTLPRSS